MVVLAIDVEAALDAFVGESISIGAGRRGRSIQLPCWKAVRDSWSAKSFRWTTIRLKAG